MDAESLIDFLIGQPLLLLAMAAILLTVAGGMIRRAVPILGRFIQGLGNLTLVAALLLTVAQVARLTTSSDFALPQLGITKQAVEGGETRVPLSGDGHFWVSATVNGMPQRFLVDTGATVTAIAESTANQSNVPEKAISQPILMRTANGTVQAQLATIDELRFGNIIARDLDAVIAPGLGDTNVIGMNLLSRLSSWRVEGRTLIMVPNPIDQLADN